MTRTRVRFTGRVQGVGFRATVRSLAHGRPVCGWVRNEPDGAVTLEAQGTPAEVDAFLAAVADRLGRFIAAADKATIAALPDETGFRIER
jgi:acylphosphatase